MENYQEQEVGKGAGTGARGPFQGQGGIQLRRQEGEGLENELCTAAVLGVQMNTRGRIANESILGKG